MSNVKIPDKALRADLCSAGTTARISQTRGPCGFGKVSAWIPGGLDIFRSSTFYITAIFYEDYF